MSKSLQYIEHAQYPILYRRRVLLMFKFAHFDINRLLMEVANSKLLVSIFGRPIISAPIINQFNEFCLIDRA